MLYTIQQAAKATGMSRQAIHAAVKKGKISASKNAQGILEVDAAEIHRVYPLVNLNEPNFTSKDSAIDTSDAENRELKARIQGLEALLAEVRSERDRWQDQADAWQMQAKALTAAPQPEPKRGFWARLFNR